MKNENATLWSTIFKIIMAVTSALLGVLGSKEVREHD